MSLLRIRRLNDEGIRRMVEFLDSQVSGSPQQYADARIWLESPETSDGLSGIAQIDTRQQFSRRFDLAEYLHARIPLLRHKDPARDAGLWAWLALAWFEQLCPLKRGQRKPGEIARWIPQLDNKRRYYRHYTLGPYLVFLAHQENPMRCLVLLTESIQISTSEIYREFVESPVLASGVAVNVAAELYLEAHSGKLRRGAGVKGPGGARRLLDVFMQFDRTFDLYSIRENRLMSMLPREFAKFRSRELPAN